MRCCHFICAAAGSIVRCIKTNIRNNRLGRKRLAEVARVMKRKPYFLFQVERNLKIVKVRKGKEASV